MARKTGRPERGKSFLAELRVAIMAAVDAGDSRTKLRACAEALIAEGMSGNVPALVMIADRLDGRVPQAIIGGDQDDAPFRAEIVWRVVDPRVAAEEGVPLLEAPAVATEEAQEWTN